MADTKAKKDRRVTSLVNRAIRLDSLTDRMISTIDPTYTDRRILSEQDAKIQEAVDRQLDILRGVSKTQLVDSLASIRNSEVARRANRRGNGKGNTALNATDLFTENIGDIFGYFQDIYKNRYLEVEDLKFISKFIPCIAEGVKMYLDSIVASDDVSETLTRIIQLPGDSSSHSNQEIIDEIKRLEDEHDLQAKLKIAYKKAMVTGTFYAYHIAYRDLFEMYSKGYAQKRMHRKGSGMMNSSMSPEKPSTGKDAPLGMMGANSPKGKKRNVLNIAQESDIQIPYIKDTDIVDVAALETNFPGQSIQINSINMAPALEHFGDVQTMEKAVEFGLVHKCNYRSAVEGDLDHIRQLASNAAPVMESYGINDVQLIGPMVSKKRGLRSNTDADKLVASIEADLPNIYFMESPVPFDMMNDVFAIAEESENYTDFFDGEKSPEDMLRKKQKEKNSGFEVAEATYDEKMPRGQSFSDITGTYIKWIDYKYIIPIEVLGKKIGYYHVLTTTKKRKARLPGSTGEIGSVLSTGSMSMFNQLDIPERRKEEAIQNIVDSISSAIMDQFSVKFVRKNANFKKVIAECIIANGIVDNDYMIQFIPVENITEFKCNMDENDRGVSILSDALFPAHQLLSFTATKMLNYINKGGNKTIAHISSGRVNRNSSNHVNRVIRDIQSANVTFTDLLSSGTVFSKITRDSNMAMPKDSQGNRLVEFEIQEGQQIEMDTQYEEMLQQWILIGMGIPQSFMDYQGNTDVARKVVSDNITVAGRVASLQSDFEKPTTELYRAIIEDSDMDEVTKAKAGTMKFKLPRPRILINQNNSEFLQTAMQEAQTVADILVGQNSNEESDGALKDEFIALQLEESVPFIDWTKKRELLAQARIRMRQKEVDKVKDDTAGDNPMDNDIEDQLNGDIRPSTGDLEDEAAGAPGLDTEPEGEEGGGEPPLDEDNIPDEEVYHDEQNPEGVDMTGLDF